MKWCLLKYRETYTFVSDTYVTHSPLDFLLLSLFLSVIEITYVPLHVPLTLENKFCVFDIKATVTFGDIVLTGLRFI
jgi:hypothetical protein